MADAFHPTNDGRIEPAPSCSRCSGSLLHELFRFTLHSPQGTWNMCPPCTGDFLVALRQAHERAGDALERAWELGA
jgi:hypothetical protein